MIIEIGIIIVSFIQGLALVVDGGYNQLGFRLDLYPLGRQQIHAKLIPEFNRNIP